MQHLAYVTQWSGPILNLKVLAAPIFQVTRCIFFSLDWSYFPDHPAAHCAASVVMVHAASVHR